MATAMLAYAVSAVFKYMDRVVEGKQKQKQNNSDDSQANTFSTCTAHRTPSHIAIRDSGRLKETFPLPLALVLNAF